MGGATKGHLTTLVEEGKTNVFMNNGQVPLFRSMTPSQADKSVCCRDGARSAGARRYTTLLCARDANIALDTLCDPPLAQFTKRSAFSKESCIMSTIISHLVINDPGLTFISHNFVTGAQCVIIQL